METIINYTGLVIGIILSIIGIILQANSTRKKEPVYSIKGNNLIAGSSAMIEKLKVLYEDMPVENVTVSKILFYNRGAETITRKDTETKSPLQINFSPSVHLLDFQLLQSNNLSNNFTLVLGKDNDSVEIDFDYLDKNQGAVIQIVHNGLKADDVVVNGAIMGVQKITKIDSKTLKPPEKPRVFLVSLGLKLFFMAMFLCGFYLLNLNIKINWALMPSVVVAVVLFFEVVPYLYNAIRNRFLPQGLEKFHE